MTHRKRKKVPKKRGKGRTVHNQGVHEDDWGYRKKEKERAHKRAAKKTQTGKKKECQDVYPSRKEKSGKERSIEGGSYGKVNENLEKRKRNQRFCYI